MNPTINLNIKESRLRLLLLDVAKHAGRLNGHSVPQLRFAGGWVRDKLLGFPSDDIDIAIDNMTGFQFGLAMKSFLQQGDSRETYDENTMGALAAIEANPEKSKHLETVTTKIFGLEVDLVNLRKETYTESSRNPMMEFGTPQEDALRRDSTINALFYNLSSQSVEDFSGRGIDDLRLRVIKTPMAPLQTFRDDPLRVLRAIRFASRFGFRVHDSDISAMKDPSIRSMLRTKISRERIGAELTKMLRGPNPHSALSLLDQVGLYSTIFAASTSDDCTADSAHRWHISYDMLDQIVRSDEPLHKCPQTDAFSILRSRLIRDANENFLAWILACFVPWARISRASNSKSEKRSPSAASSAAREGIKADNKVCKVIDEAIKNLDQVLDLKVTDQEARRKGETPPQEISLSLKREKYGMAIRNWGANWRCNVLFALLTEVSEADTKASRLSTLAQYAAWLRTLEHLELFDADQIKPLVNGKALCEAIGVREAGPWVKRALDVIVGWQLRHPHVTDAAAAIQEVLLREDEIGLPQHPIAQEPVESKARLDETQATRIAAPSGKVRETP